MQDPELFFVVFISPVAQRSTEKELDRHGSLPASDVIGVNASGLPSLLS